MTERWDVYTRDAARKLGDERSQGVLPMQLVTAVRADDEHRSALQRSRQERQELARGTISPVQVFEHQKNRSFFALVLEEVCDCFVETAPVV